MASDKRRPFCWSCGMATDDAGLCPNPRCRLKPAEPAPARRLSDDDLESYAALLARIHNRPLRVGERHWEVVDKDGFIMLRVETSDSKHLAPVFAALPEMVGRLLEHLAATGG